MNRRGSSCWAHSETCAQLYLAQCAQDLPDTSGTCGARLCHAWPMRRSLSRLTEPFTVRDVEHSVAHCSLLKQAQPALFLLLILLCATSCDLGLGPDSESRSSKAAGGTSSSQAHSTAEHPSTEVEESSPPQNQSLDLDSLSALEVLSGPFAGVVGTRCGIGGHDPREWRAVYELVDACDVDALSDVATSASTREGRVLGLTGLYRLGMLDAAGVREHLARLDGQVRTCAGCRNSRVPAASLIEFVLNAPPPAQRRQLCSCIRN